ncbi:uncharacterized protein LOC121871557 [Homarus americanus]|uniref:uncharacterized protein LOC121871557 n=1 Tax=Homarus americanus TaxID=6706 RepID=UPI001C46636E|nr:uncharacterized protein LOC121871557 [Homarus americanus]
MASLLNYAILNKKNYFCRVSQIIILLQDPKWSYMAKLATDEERYQHTRKLWKSIVVPDPNVNNTYSGYSRRWGIQRNYSEDTSSTTRVKVSKKRKHELEEDNPEQPPKKRARGILDIRFSVQRFNESMSLVTLSYMEEQNLQHRSSFQSLKLEKTYNEKIHQLIMARVEKMATSHPKREERDPMTARLPRTIPSKAANHNGFPLATSQLLSQSARPDAASSLVLARILASGG